MTAKQRKQLEAAKKKLTKCGGDCIHCDKCHLYTGGNSKTLYYAVGCDLLPADMYDYIADTPKQLHAAALELANFELS